MRTRDGRRTPAVRAALGLMMLLVAAGPAAAQSSASFKLLPGAFGSGGRSSSSGFVVNGDVGGARSASNGYDLVSGFTGGAFSNVMTSTVTTSGGGYACMTFPVRAADRTVSAVLSELGGYDVTKWRLGHWSPVDSAYMEPGSAGGLDLTALDPGQGYWLVTKSDAAVTDVGTPVPPTTFTIGLTAGPSGRPAWNQVANPFPFPIAVSDLQVVNGGTTFALTNPGNTLTDNVVKIWSAGSFSDATVVNGRTAFWVHRKAVAGTTSVTVPFKASATGSPAPARLRPEGADWAVAITAREGDRTAEPLVIGATSLAAGPACPLDHTSIPGPPGANLLRVRIPKTSWGVDNGDYVSEFLAADPRMSWEIVIGGGDAPGEIALEVAAEGLPAGLTLRLVDPADGTVRSLVPGQSLTLPATAADKRYRVEATSSDTASPLTAKDGFDLAYPNPFRASVGLHFALARAADLTIDVFDLQGRLVRSIERRGAAAGDHVVVWDGRDAAGRAATNGVYLARWRAGAAAGTQRIVKVD